MNDFPPHRHSTVPSSSGDDGDRLRRVVHGLLILYLLPAVLVVLLVGILLMLITGLARLVVILGDGFARTSLSHPECGSLARIIATSRQWHPCDHPPDRDPHDPEEQTAPWRDSDLAPARD